MNGLVVDLFAGGGGASEGIRRALGRCPDIAINHCAHAVEMHALNHPTTRHIHTDVREVDPRAVVAGREVDLLWASPDCTHFSRAKGAKPRSSGLRTLAWVIIDGRDSEGVKGPGVGWARDVRPRTIIMENVCEFTTWGPLDAQGLPDPHRRGESFKAFVDALLDLGYTVDWRVLTAAEFGIPTSRRRWFLVASLDGPVVWPEPTHGPGRIPFRTAAECIDWSLPIPSIFGRRRPLAEATERRIAEGVKRFVLNAERPFLLHVTHGGRLHPIPTITAAHRGELALAVPSLIQTGYGERDGQAPRVLDLHRPLGTIVSGGKHALVCAFLAKHFGGVVGHGVDRPLSTVTAKDHHALVAANLVKFYGTSSAASVDAPMPTITAGGGRGGGHTAVAAFMLKYYGQGGQWSALDEPMHTIVSKARMGLVTVHVAGDEYVIDDIGMRMLAPREMARGQGFADDYQLIGSKAQQTARIGNSVCPGLAEALVRANVERRREAA